ncbi:MAG TPA: PBS lyase, partial [Cyanobacteria bacterium UBA9579]|nr:PBS lyase [Cyanobacteria bacterium UBA9579]
MSIKVNNRKKKSEKTFEELIHELQHSNSEKVRYNAARMLGELSDSRAVEPLIDVLKNDKNGSVRLYAARALGELGDVSATTPLIESLRD